MTLRASLLLFCCVLGGCATDRPHRGPPGNGGPGDAAGGRRDDGVGGPLFASPMGEPFRGPGGERRWFDGADRNHDGALVVAEMEADALRFFAILDQGKDGEIDPDDIQRYETILFPEIRVAGAFSGPRDRSGSAGQGRRGRGGGMGGGGAGRSRGGGGGGDRSSADPGGRATASTAGRQGAGRFGYLDLPEPVTSADSNFNRGVSTSEFIAAARARFAQLDANHDGRLTLAELPSLRRGPASGGARKRPDADGEQDSPIP